MSDERWRQQTPKFVLFCFLLFSLRNSSTTTTASERGWEGSRSTSTTPLPRAPGTAAPGSRPSATSTTSAATTPVSATVSFNCHMFCPLSSLLLTATFVVYMQRVCTLKGAPTIMIYIARNLPIQGRKAYSFKFGAVFLFFLFF